MEKTLGNTTASQAKENVPDIIFWGDGDTFKLISKASSKSEGWMKSTKAMEIVGVGCVVQVTTQQLQPTGVIIPDPNVPSKDWKMAHTSSIAEAVTFVPGVKIDESFDKEGKVIGRKLIQIK